MDIKEFNVEDITFSYSSLSTYETCPYSFKLKYIKRYERVNNFFAEYGLLIHDCMEEYFNKRLESYELTNYFLDNYYLKVTTPIPPYLSEDKYRQQAIEFFDNFSFDRDIYDVIGIENTIDFTYEGYKFTGRPDLILRNRINKKNILLDYKSSTPFKYSKYTKLSRLDDKKIAGYHTQLFLYTYGLRESLDIKIDELTLWFTRPNRLVVIPWTQKEEQKALDKLLKIIKKIENDTLFIYDNSSSFFCNHICGVRDYCQYKNLED